MDRKRKDKKTALRQVNNGNERKFKKRESWKEVKMTGVRIRKDNSNE